MLATKVKAMQDVALAAGCLASFPGSFPHPHKSLGMRLQVAMCLNL